MKIGTGDEDKSPSVMMTGKPYMYWDDGDGDDADFVPAGLLKGSRYHPHCLCST